MSFVVMSVEKLTINFCFVLNCTLPLFCAGMRLSQHMRIQEITYREDMKEAVLVGICPINQLGF